jgi:hypothetical protein
MKNFQAFLESLRHEQKKLDLKKFKYAFHWVNDGNLFCQVYDEESLSEKDKTAFVLKKIDGKRLDIPTKFPKKRFILGGEENDLNQDDSSAVCLTLDPTYLEAGFTGESHICIVFEIKDLGEIRDLTDNGEAEIRCKVINNWVEKAKEIFVTQKAYTKGDDWEEFEYRPLSEWLPSEVKEKLKICKSIKEIGKELEKYVDSN